jgi:hypothetical protein
MPPKYSLQQALLAQSQPPQEDEPLRQMSIFAPALYDMMSLAPVSSDPKKERKQSEAEAKNRNLDTTIKFAEPVALTKMIENTDPFRKQKMGIMNQYEIMREDIKRPTQVDLSPLLAMADRMSGGSSLKAYRQPQSSADFMDRVRAHVAGIQKSRNEYQDNLTNQINSLKAGQTQQLSEALLKSMAGTQAQNQASGMAQDRMRSYAIRDMQKSHTKEEEPYKKVYSSARIITDLAKSGNPLNKKNLETLLFNLRGDRGAPSNYDTMGTAENQGLVERLEQRFSTLKGEGLDEENAKLVLDIARRYKDAASVTLRRLRRQSGERAEAAYGHIGITRKDLSLGGPDIQERKDKIAKYESFLDKTKNTNKVMSPEALASLEEKRAKVSAALKRLKEQQDE